jgi:hypothetical protein
MTSRHTLLLTAVLSFGCGSGDSVSPPDDPVPDHSGTYTLVTVSGRPLPSSLGGESCVQPPLTVCSIQEFATRGVAGAGRG